jgi:hypothetical protein
MNHERQTTGTASIALATLLALAACGEEPPPTSVSQFVENPILLEATMVGCVENRAEARYDPECLNAREAVNRIAAREEAARRAELEAQSDRKRQALRRAQEAAAEARRRALEEQRRREEAELLGPFAPRPGEDAEPAPGQGERRELPSPEPADEAAPQEPAQQPSQETDSPPAGDEPGDLESIRRELERRQPESDQQPPD